MIIHYKNDLDSSVLFTMKVCNMEWFSILNMCLNMPLRVPGRPSFDHF